MGIGRVQKTRKCLMKDLVKSLQDHEVTTQISWITFNETVSEDLIGGGKKCGKLGKGYSCYVVVEYSTTLLLQ